MKYTRSLAISVFLAFFCAVSQSQVIAVSSSGNACDSLTATFSLSPDNVNDTISSIFWNFGDGKSARDLLSPEHQYEKPGKFRVTALINSVTTLSLVIPVEVYNSPDASFGFRDSVALGSYFYVFKNVNQEVDSFSYSYQWQFEGVPTGTSQSIIHGFPNSGIYTVSLVVENNHGCIDSVSRKVNVTDVLEIPNVFTPNYDGYNDFFKVRTNGLNKYEFLVYAKSGILVYKTESAVINWDGRSMSGLELQPGTYYYVIRQLDGDPLVERSGFLELLK